MVTLSQTMNDLGGGIVWRGERPRERSEPGFKRLARQIYGLKPQIQRFTHQIQPLARQIRRLKPKIQRLSRQIQWLNPQIRRFARQIREVNCQIVGLDGQISPLSNPMEKLAFEIPALTRQMNRLKPQIRQWRKSGLGQQLLRGGGHVNFRRIDVPDLHRGRAVHVAIVAIEADSALNVELIFH